MTSKYIRSLALLLCAAFLGCLLAACGGSASSPASSAAPASDSASASGSSELPSSTTEANTGELNPGNFDENSVFSITGTSNAFAPCLGDRKSTRLNLQSPITISYAVFFLKKIFFF